MSWTPSSSWKVGSTGSRVAGLLASRSLGRPAGILGRAVGLPVGRRYCSAGRRAAGTARWGTSPVTSVCVKRRGLASPRGLVLGIAGKAVNEVVAS